MENRATSRRPGPAHRLLGMTLPGGWEVVERVERPPGSSGGNLSVGYIVEQKHEGVRAYMKAHDYAAAIGHPDGFGRAIERMVSGSNFERDLHETCSSMSRVVTTLCHGELEVADSELPVTYLIFELADGDVRSRLGPAPTSLGQVAWRLRTLHQVAVAIAQLHGAGVHHQDVKPSNVLDFGRDGSKLGDLGSAEKGGKTASIVEKQIGGDPSYAPPEALYQFELPDRVDRFRAQDMYLLGSLALFLFTGVDTTTAILAKLDSDHYPTHSGTSFETTLPHLQHAFAGAMHDFRQELSPYVPEELVVRYQELCQPDPRLRGHPRAQERFGSRFSLERYVSRFDAMASQIQAGRAPSLAL